MLVVVVVGAGGGGGCNNDPMIVRRMKPIRRQKSNINRQNDQVFDLQPIL